MVLFPPALGRLSSGNVSQRIVRVSPICLVVIIYPNVVNIHRRDVDAGVRAVAAPAKKTTDLQCFYCNFCVFFTVLCLSVSVLCITVSWRVKDLYKT